MAHQIEVINNVGSTFTVGDAPWHGLGTILDKPPTIKEGIVDASLDWQVDLHQLGANVCVGVDETGNPILRWLPTDSKATVRSTDHKVLGVVGSDYTLVQNIEAFEFFQPAIDNGLVTLESAGSLFGGARIWVLAKSVNTTVDIVKDDPVNCYALLANSHDGKSTIYFGSTAIRVVCNNTLTAARNSKASQLLKLKHTKNVHIGLKELQSAFNFQRMEWSATAEAMQRMASYGVDQATINAYVKEVFEPEVSVRAPNKESAERSYLKLIQKIQPLMENGRGNDNPRVRGTMWGLYNGVTEYLSYQKGRDSEDRLASNWFGLNRVTNQRAFDVAIKMAA